MACSEARAMQCVKDPQAISYADRFGNRCASPQGHSPLGPHSSYDAGEIMAPLSRRKSGGSQPRLGQPGSRRRRNPLAKALLGGAGKCLPTGSLGEKALLCGIGPSPGRKDSRDGRFKPRE